jgi:hypothetical protein
MYCRQVVMVMGGRRAGAGGWMREGEGGRKVLHLEFRELENWSFGKVSFFHLKKKGGTVLPVP